MHIAFFFTMPTVVFNVMVAKDMQVCVLTVQCALAFAFIIRKDRRIQLTTRTLLQPILGIIFVGNYVYCTWRLHVPYDKAQVLLVDGEQNIMKKPRSWTSWTSAFLNF